jgi:hypothetical protein
VSVRAWPPVFGKTAFQRTVYALRLEREIKAAACNVVDARKVYCRLARLGLAIELHWQRMEALRDCHYQLSLAFVALGLR